MRLTLPMLAELNAIKVFSTLLTDTYTDNGKPKSEEIADMLMRDGQGPGISLYNDKIKHYKARLVDMLSQTTVKVIHFLYFDTLISN